MDRKTIAAGLKKGKVERVAGEIGYLRVRDGFAGIERGTVVLEPGRPVYGFPHIKRVFTLEKGLQRNMGDCSLFAEEKIDGFNVRVASHNGRIYAFSRGGFLDLFVTEKAREMGLEGFFRERPEQVLCGEMIGSTPYTEPSEGFDVRLFIFDIDRGDGAYLPCEERYEALRKHSIQGVPVIGKFRSDDYAGLRKTILSLNKGKKEGMVLKSEDRAKAVKYVTPWSDIDDISKDVGILFDMPIGFYYQRVLRSAFFISDFGLDRKEYSAKLGSAFYEGLIGSLKKASETGSIDQEFEISIRDPKVWDDIRRHMSREVRIEELYRRDEDGRTRIRFRKIYKRTSRLLSSYAGGKGVMD